METDNRLKLNGFITKYTQWDAAIDGFVMQFHKKYNVYPNILLGNAETFRKIDLYAQMHPSRLRQEGSFESFETSNEPYAGISNFVTEDYILEFCLDYDLTDGNFTLIYDEDPDFDGEPVPEPAEKEPGVYQFRKIA